MFYDSDLLLAFVTSNRRVIIRIIVLKLNIGETRQVSRKVPAGSRTSSKSEPSEL